MKGDPPYVLAFNCWGKPIFAQEVAFCVRSALYWLGDRAGEVRIVVYTDDAAPLARLPVEPIVISSEQLAAWRGPADYFARTKILILADLLQRFGKPTLLIDSDTYFIKSPLALFGRLRPGATLMHVWESVLRYSPDPDYSSIAAKLNAAPFKDRAGQLDPVSADMPSWNSGVLGIHPADAPLLADVLHTCDEMLRITGVRTAEQLAFAHVFARRTKLRPAWDAVYHYFTWRLRADYFVKVLPKIMEDLQAIPPAEQNAWLYARRPRCRFRRRVRVNAEHALRRLGFLKSKMVFTSESF